MEDPVTTTLTDSTIVLTGSAQEAIREAMTMCHKAHAWITTTLIEEGDYETVIRERIEAVREMEGSFHKSFVQLMLIPQGHDGELRFWRDMEGCLYWRHAKSGYEGGVIFHRNHKWPEESGIGSWSVHT